MKEIFSNPIISGLILAIVAFFIGVVKERSENKTKMLQEQRFKYLLPLKHYAEDFCRRLVHIENRLSRDPSDKKCINMKCRFSHDLIKNQKPFEWHFNDSVNQGGGYYITSTLYMNCILYYWIRRILLEYPYIPIKAKKSIGSFKTSKLKYLRRCYNDGYLKLARKKLPSNRKLDINKIINHIKISLSGESGIAYGVQDSLGDYIFDNHGDRLLNYEEFCTQLHDDKNKIKFLPLLKFWCNLFTENGELIDIKLNKIRRLIVVLTVLNFSDLR